LHVKIKKNTRKCKENSVIDIYLAQFEYRKPKKGKKEAFVHKGSKKV